MQEQPLDHVLPLLQRRARLLFQQDQHSLDDLEQECLVFFFLLADLESHDHACCSDSKFSYYSKVFQLLIENNNYYYSCFYYNQ